MGFFTFAVLAGVTLALSIVLTDRKVARAARQGSTGALTSGDRAG